MGRLLVASVPSQLGACCRGVCICKAAIVREHCQHVPLNGMDKKPVGLRASGSQGREEA